MQRKRSTVSTVFEAKESSAIAEAQAKIAQLAQDEASIPTMLEAKTQERA
jgi:hypothetical protein